MRQKTNNISQTQRLCHRKYISKSLIATFAFLGLGGQSNYLEEYYL